MLIIAKLALGVASTVAVAGAYTFHAGVINVDVDQFEKGGSHVHVFVPAALVPVAMRFVPQDTLNHPEALGASMPMLRKLAEELKKYPNVEFVDVQDGDDHVQIRTRNGKLQIDVHEPNQSVHVSCPLGTIENLASNRRL